jgi:PAS domain-containing protein
LKDLIGSFWRHYSALKVAVAKEDLGTIAKLDSELTQTIEQIINRPARDMGELVHQFRFATDLINVEADDVSCVKRNIDLIRKLVDKYVGMGIVPDGSGPSVHQAGNLPYSVLDEDMYDEQSAAFVVFKDDYTVSYANPAFSSMLDLAGESVVGRHAADLLGFKLFRSDLQIRIDDCINGAILRFTHSEEISDETFVKIYEFSPCYSPSQSFVGALVKLSVIADRRALRIN